MLGKQKLQLVFWGFPPPWFWNINLVGLGGRENQCTHHWRYYYPFMVLFIPPLGHAEHWGEVRSYMLRLLEAGLHSPEHVLFINTMMEVSNQRFSAHIQHGVGGGECTGSPAASWGTWVGFGLCSYLDMDQQGNKPYRLSVVWAVRACPWVGVGVEIEGEKERDEW